MEQKQKNLTRAELATAIFHKLGVAQTEAHDLIDQILEEMTKALQNEEKGGDDGGSMKIAGFGTFKSKIRRGRVGRNPQTGVQVDISPYYGISFKPAREMRKQIDLSLKKLKGLPQ